jgi:uncharacterized repeat protein (TIGR02543 family)
MESTDTGRERYIVKHFVRAVVCLLLAEGVSSAATYYVSPSGNDAADGLSPATAWRTVAKVNNAALVPGDTVLFSRGGTWNERIQAQASGVSGMPITYGAYGSGTIPLISQGFRADAKDHVVVRDLRFTQSVRILHGSYNTVDSCRVDDNSNDYGGILVGYWWGASDPWNGPIPHHNNVYNSTVTGNTWSGIEVSGKDKDQRIYSCEIRGNHCYNNGCGVYFHYVASSTLSQNILHDNTVDSWVGEGYGAGFQTSAYNDINGNIMYNNRTSGMEIWSGTGGANNAYGHSDGNSVHHNIIYNNGVGGGTNVHGIFVSGGNTAQTRDTRIYYNVLYGNAGRNVQISCNDAVRITGVVYNNTMYGKGFAMYNAEGTTVSGWEIRNNIFHTCNWYFYEARSSVSVTHSNNVFYAASVGFSDYNYPNSAIPSFEATASTQDPRFVDLNNRDFHLQPNSPCIDAGVDVGLAYDFDRLPIWGTPDIGAYEFQAGTNTPPAVSLTSPVNNSTYTAPADILLTATAGDPDGSIANVRFYSGTTLLNTDTSSPYLYIWTGVGAGSYALRAVAQDNQGAVSTSAVVAITVLSSGPNQPPVVSLTSPVNNSTYSVAADIVLRATASDPDGGIARVEFYTGTTLLNSDTTSPYEYTWSRVGAGTYVLSARAYDVLNASATSGGVTVSVLGRTAQAPFVLAAPVIDGSGADWAGIPVGITYRDQSGRTPASVDNAVSVKAGWDTGYLYLLFETTDTNLQAVTSQRDGAVYMDDCVEVFIDTAADGGASMRTDDYHFVVNILNTLFDSQGTGSGQSAAWNGNPAVISSVAVRGTIGNEGDADGGYTVEVAIPWASIGVVPASGMVLGMNFCGTDRDAAGDGYQYYDWCDFLTSPVTGSSYTAPANITFAATATDSDGSIARVEFWTGATLLNSDTSSPYSYSWTGVAAGGYALRAIAYDNTNTTSTSAIVNITVNPPPNQPPVVSLTSPVNNSTYTAPATLNLAATATDPDGSIASVRFYRGSTLLATDTASPYEYTWTNVSSGTYQLRAVAQDNQGATSTSTIITVTVLSSSTPRLWYTLTATANPANGGTVTPASGTYLAGSQIQVTATPNANYTFATWSGDASGTNPTVTLTMDSDKSITANFTYVPPANSSPTVSITSPQDGATFAAPASITITATATDSDGSIAAVRFYAGTTLLATDSTSPYEYTWTGVPAGSYILTVQAQDNQGAVGTSTAIGITVSAQAVYYTLTVNANPSNGGTITQSPTGSSHLAGTPVTVTATPSAGYEFAGWSGDITGSSTTNPMTVVMDADKVLTANFRQLQSQQPSLTPGEVRIVGGLDGYINATTNPNVTIRFRRTSAGTVTVKVYDLRGRLVMEKTKDGQAGIDDDIAWNAAELPAGVYIARVKGGGMDTAKRAVILR